MAYRAPTRPPFAVGTRVRYNSVMFAHGDPPGPWLRPGEVGIVVKTTPGSPASGLWLGDYHDIEPQDGWSTVRYFDDPGYDRAVFLADVREGRFQKVKGAA